MRTVIQRVASLLVMIGALLCITTPPVMAVDVLQSGCEAGGSTQFCQDVNASKGTDRILGPDGLVTKVLQVIVILTGAISVIMVVIGGMKYAFSGGDSSGVQSAKNTIMYALIGLVVAIFAQVIVSFVLSKL